MPEQAKPYADYTSNLCFSIANACGLITALQTSPAEPRGEKTSKKEDSPKPKAKKAADHSRKKALKMLDEEIEKKSGFAKMLEAAKSMIKRDQRADAKQLPTQDEDEESQIVNKDSGEGDEAKKLIKAEECEEEFQIQFEGDE